MEKKALIVAFTGLAAFLLYKNAFANYSSQYTQIDAAPDEGADPDFEPIEDVGVTMGLTPTRGERNNNPGNIRKGPAWQGLAADQSGDMAFAVFTTPEYGIRALGKLLQNYQSQGFNTVRAVINKYAPSNENNTGAYINAVASALHVAPDSPIDLNDPATLVALTNAIIQHENGRNIYAATGITDSGIAMIG